LVSVYIFVSLRWNGSGKPKSDSIVSSRRNCSV
jgi:hypothetical protein